MGRETHPPTPLVWARGWGGGVGGFTSKSVPPSLAGPPAPVWPLGFFFPPRCAYEHTQRQRRNLRPMYPDEITPQTAPTSSPPEWTQLAMGPTQPVKPRPSQISMKVTSCCGIR